MDIQMSEMDGITATKKIRELEKQSGAHIPMLALTASVLREDIELCLQSGMDNVIGKPINFISLFSAMESAVPADQGQINNHFNVDIKESIVIDFSSLKNIANTEKGLATWKSPDAYAKALKTFAKEHSECATKMQNALNNNPEIIKQLSHMLKGLAGNLFLEKTAQLSAEIDIAIKNQDNNTTAEFIHLLKEELNNVIVAIERFQTPEQTKVLAEKPYDPVAVQVLLNNLIITFSELNPEPSNKIIEKISEYIAEEQLTAIREYLEQFDFDAAEEATRLLAKNLDLIIKDI
jgi:DNA-binding NarL/FixJ family response regulator